MFAVALIRGKSRSCFIFDLRGLSWFQSSFAKQMDTAGSVATRLAALSAPDHAQFSSLAAFGSGRTLSDSGQSVAARLAALQSALSAQTPASPPGPSPPAPVHEPSHERVPTGKRYVPVGPAELVDKEKIGADLQTGCRCARNCLRFWNVDAVFPYHELESKRNHRERLKKVLDYVEHCPKTSRGYNEYIVEVMCCC